MAKQRKQRDYDRDDDDADDREYRPPAKRRGGSRLFWFASRLFVVLILLAVLAFFAPILIGSTGLWKTILASAVPKLSGKVDARSLQLSWLSPLVIDDLVVRDPGGQPLAEVTRIGSRKSLLQIALNTSDLGVFDVLGPKAKIILRPEGSNVEDLLASLPKSDSQPGEPPQFGVIVSNGSVLIDDQVAGRQWQVDGINVDLTWTAGAEAKTGKLSAAINSAGNATGNTPGGLVAAEFSWQPGPGQTPTLGAGQAQVSLQNVPTEMSKAR